jgi:hypothetical protein
VIAFAVEVQDNASPAVDRVASFLTGPGAVKVLAITGRNVVKRHLADLQATRPNKLGGPRTDYYGAAARATNWKADETGAYVIVSQVGMRLHYYGGTVTAGKNSSYLGGGQTKYLAIPAVSFAHGKRPSDFGDKLKVIFGKGRRPVALGRRYMGQTTIVFWLAKSTTHRPDPSVLPAPEDYQDELREAITDAARRRFKNQPDQTEGET